MFYFTIHDFRFGIKNRTDNLSVKHGDMTQVRQIFIRAAKLMDEQMLIAPRTVQVPEGSHGH
jgi:hypothetical protein